jgi:hypothetical protein
MCRSVGVALPRRTPTTLGSRRNRLPRLLEVAGRRRGTSTPPHRQRSEDGHHKQQHAPAPGSMRRSLRLHGCVWSYRNAFIERLTDRCRCVFDAAISVHVAPSEWAAAVVAVGPVVAGVAGHVAACHSRARQAGLGVSSGWLQCTHSLASPVRAT